MTATRSDALVFFGASGDLAYKKICPAFHAMERRGNLDFPIIGVARSGWTLERLRASCPRKAVRPRPAVSAGLDGAIGTMLPHDGGDAEDALDELTRAGIDVDRLAAVLQREGAAAFVESWDELLACIEQKSAMLESTRT